MKPVNTKQLIAAIATLSLLLILTSTAMAWNGNQDCSTPEGFKAYILKIELEGEVWYLPPEEGDDDDYGDDDYGDDDDDDDDYTPIPPEECNAFCTNWAPILSGCGMGSEQEVLSMCLSECGDGNIPQDAEDCFTAAGGDCEELMECIGEPEAAAGDAYLEHAIITLFESESEDGLEMDLTESGTYGLQDLIADTPIPAGNYERLIVYFANRTMVKGQVHCPHGLTPEGWAEDPVDLYTKASGEFDDYITAPAEWQELYIYYTYDEPETDEPYHIRHNFEEPLVVGDGDEITVNLLLTTLASLVYDPVPSFEEGYEGFIEESGFYFGQFAGVVMVGEDVEMQTYAFRFTNEVLGEGYPNRDRSYLALFWLDGELFHSTTIQAPTYVTNGGSDTMGISGDIDTWNETTGEIVFDVQSDNPDEACSITGFFLQDTVSDEMQFTGDWVYDQMPNTTLDDFYGEYQARRVQ